MPKVVKLHAPSTHISNSKCPKFRLSTDFSLLTHNLS
jgi:hypothetical protein